MNTHTILAFTAIAALSIMSPGPAVLLSLRNGASFKPARTDSIMEIASR